MSTELLVHFQDSRHQVETTDPLSITNMTATGVFWEELGPGRRLGDGAVTKETVPVRAMPSSSHRYHRILGEG